MSNLTARRAYNVTLESKVKELAEQKGAAVVSAKGNEERFNRLLNEKEDLALERGQLTETLAVLQAENKGQAELWAHTEAVLQGRIATLEQQLVDERASLTPRIEQAEVHARSLQKERDTLVGDKANLQQELSSVVAEKRGLEELSRRLEAQLPPLRDEKQQVVLALEAAEAKCAELAKQREGDLAERARLVEELSVLRAEKKGAEELAKRESQQLDEQLQAATLRIEPVEERAKEAARARDALSEERSHLAEQLAVLQAERRRAEELMRKAEAAQAQALDDKAASNARADAADARVADATHAKEAAVAERARAEEQLAVALSERKRVEELARLAESKLKDELAAVSAHAAFAEERCKEVAGQRDAADAERAKALEKVPPAVAGQRAAEEQLAVLAAEKKGAEEAARRLEEQLRHEVHAATERIKPVEARCVELQRACDAVHDERHRLARELTQAVAAHRAVEESCHAVTAEKRQLEQQLLYVHALTRPAHALPSAPPPPTHLPPAPEMPRPLPRPHAAYEATAGAPAGAALPSPGSSALGYCGASMGVGPSGAPPYSVGAASSPPAHGGCPPPSYYPIPPPGGGGGEAPPWSA